MLGAGGDRGEARALLARALRREPPESMPAAERDWGRILGTAADLRDTALARWAYGGYVRDVASQAADSVGAVMEARGLVAQAEGRWQEVLRATDEAFARFEIMRPFYDWMRAEAFDSLQRPDSALAYYQHFLRNRWERPFSDALYRAKSLVRSGELYEAAGKPRDAIAQYEEFLQIWKSADAELQPKVREVRERVGRLKRVVG
jgi:tetratricopeptide (TPR) repeat protein